MGYLTLDFLIPYSGDFPIRLYPFAYSTACVILDYASRAGTFPGFGQA